ncbi:translocation protein TolB [Luteitalea pratensis]|uniref:Translocation protein TolB n=1 Tax=Luteitalea pratensis TaxID=1855912 RepID=A0A143PKA1_LUTPR|nr:winged helix-turn-helix domain-containing protein [Luteitalea pratensis]AMY08508.1 translocation protein TolB [Luteitalea pratensis]
MQTPAAARAIGFGPFRVDPRTRELRKGGSRIRVPEQSVRILLSLLDRAGDVVTRDELAAMLWPSDTLVDIEHGLNSAVRRLRDALADSAERPLYIETVPRVGYRFVGTVAVPQALPDLTAVEDDDAEPRLTTGTQAESTVARVMSSAPQRRWLVATAMVLLATMVTIAAWRGKRTEGAAATARPLPVPLTFEGGLQTDPNVSPDGQWIAYASNSGGNFDIWIRRLSGGDPVQVTQDAASDSQPDWSPDGSRLVFRSERAGGGVFVVPATGGASRRISPRGFRPRWSPDGRHVVFAEHVLTGLNLNLQVIAADGGAPRHWPGRSLGAFGWQPRSSSVLMFASLFGPFEPTLESWTVGAASTTRWVVADKVVGAFRAERLVVVAGEELIPSSDLSSLYFIGASRGTRALWRIDIDATARRVVSGPHRLTTLPEANNANLSPDGRRVVFDGSARNAQILSYALSNEKLASDPVPLTSDVVHAEMPTLSRDGRAFAFVLTRPGSPDRSELVGRWPGESRDRTIRVINEPGEVLALPRWNSNGTKLVYGFVSNATEPSAQQQLRIFEASTGEDTPLTSAHAVVTMEFPSGWTPDGRHILVASSMYAVGKSAIALLPIDAAPAAEHSRRPITSAADASLSAAVMSPDARWVAFRVRDFEGQAAPRIAIVSARGGDRAAWTFVTGGIEPADKPCWSDDGATLYFTSGGSGAMNVWGVRFDAVRGVPVGEPFKVTAFDGPGTHILSDIRVMELGAGGGRLMFPVVRPKGGLWMLELGAH